MIQQTVGLGIWLRVPVLALVWVNVSLWHMRRTVNTTDATRQDTLRHEDRITSAALPEQSTSVTAS